MLRHTLLTAPPEILSTFKSRYGGLRGQYPLSRGHKRNRGLGSHQRLPLQPFKATYIMILSAIPMPQIGFSGLFRP